MDSAPMKPLTSPEKAGIEDSFDFVTELGQRLGVCREVAALILGDWLSTYEPRQPRPIHVLEPRQAAIEPPPSTRRVHQGDRKSVGPASVRAAMPPSSL